MRKGFFFHRVSILVVLGIVIFWCSFVINATAQKTDISEMVIKPDLVITDILIDNHTICYEIMNIGDTEAPEGHITALMIDEVQKAVHDVEVNLEPGASTLACFE